MVPPKPKLFDMTEFNVTFFSILVTIGKFLAPSSISVMLADAAIKLIDSPNFAKEISKNGRIRVKNKFDLNQHVIGIQSCIEKAIS